MYIGKFVDWEESQSMLVLMPKRIRLFIDTDAHMRAAVNLRALKTGIKAKDLLLAILKKEFAAELRETNKYPVAQEDDEAGD
jgi:hypothetical protein